jgi:hypothetical protein
MPSILLFFILSIIVFGAPHRRPAIEIKLELDTKKPAKAALAIAAAYGLCRVSEGTKSNQLAATNALTLIIIITIIYGPHLVPQKSV